MHIRIPESFSAKFTLNAFKVHRLNLARSFALYRVCTDSQDLAIIRTRTVPSTFSGLSLNCDISSRTGKETLPPEYRHTFLSRHLQCTFDFLTEQCNRSEEQFQVL